jgi:hypothetical protein
VSDASAAEVTSLATTAIASRQLRSKPVSVIGIGYYTRSDEDEEDALQLQHQERQDLRYGSLGSYMCDLI